MNIVESIYLLFQDWYSTKLRDFLSGYDCATEAFTGANVYSQVGFWTAGISLVLVCLFYIKVIDPVSMKRPKWGFMLLMNSLLTAGVAYYIVDKAERVGEIGECLLRDGEGNYLISWYDYLGFALSNAVIAAVLFFLLSLVLKYLSTNNRYTPF